jgi:hypothetical protein
MTVSLAPVPKLDSDGEKDGGGISSGALDHYEQHCCLFVDLDEGLA